MGAGLRPTPKGVDKPPYPTDDPAASSEEVPEVIGQESAEAIVAVKSAKADGAKGRTEGRGEHQDRSGSKEAERRSRRLPGQESADPGGDPHVTGSHAGESATRIDA